MSSILHNPYDLYNNQYDEDTSYWIYHDRKASRYSFRDDIDVKGEKDIYIYLRFIYAVFRIFTTDATLRQHVLTLTFLKLSTDAIIALNAYCFEFLLYSF